MIVPFRWLAVLPIAAAMVAVVLAGPVLARDTDDDDLAPSGFAITPLAAAGRAADPGSARSTGRRHRRRSPTRQRWRPVLTGAYWRC